MHIIKISLNATLNRLFMSAFYKQMMYSHILNDMNSNFRRSLSYHFISQGHVNSHGKISMPFKEKFLGI